MILVGIIWLVLTFVIGVAAERRGRSGFGWFLLALFLSPLIAGILLAVFPDKNLRALLEEPRRTSAVDDRALLQNIEGGRRKGSAAIKIIGMAVVFAVFAAFVAAIWVGWSAIQPNIQVKNEETKKANDAGFANTTDWKEAQRLGLHTEKEVQDWRYHQIIKDASQQKPTVYNGSNAYLLSLTEAARAQMLGKVIGEGCSGKLTFYMGTGTSGLARDHAFWSVRCQDGRAYVVEAHPDGTSNVLECSVLKTLHAGECFKKLSD